MEKIIKFLMISSLIGLLGLASLPDNGDAANVTTWATVGSMYTCTPTGSALAFGTVDNTSVYSTTDNATTTITANTVVYLKVNDAGNASNPGLNGATTTPANIIGSADDSFTDNATLVADTEGFGLRAATTTAGSNNTLNLSARYNLVGQAATWVGGFELSGSAVALASTTAGITTTREVVSYFRVAVNASTPAGDYTDTITYTCTTTP